MFRKIQNNILVHQPLLWNTKTIPALLVAVFFHVLFLFLGYSFTTIDFSSEYGDYKSDSLVVMLVCFSVLVSILTLVIWLVFYTRNNGLKSYYPKSATLLYKEWLLVLLVCALNTTYYISISVGQNLKQRGYVSKDETLRRAEIIGMASIFLSGNNYEPITQPEEAGQYKDTKPVAYRDKCFSIESLFNKNIDNSLSNYTYNKKDSLNTIRVKDWLFENKKDSVQWLMDSFFEIAGKYDLQSSINSKEWLEKTYKYPDFDTYEAVYGSKTYYGYDHAEKAIKEATAVIAVYYVPYDALVWSHGKLYKAWTNPLTDYEGAVVLLYLGFGISFSIFSFRLTSGREWLIALISLGVLAIFFGILTIVGSETRVYDGSSFMSLFYILWVLLTLAVLVAFLRVVRANRTKGMSGILLNLVLWLGPFLLPLLYSILWKFLYYQDYDYTYYQLLQTYFFHFMLANLVVVGIVMYFFSGTVKRWKGIADE